MAVQECVENNYNNNDARTKLSDEQRALATKKDVGNNHVITRGRLPRPLVNNGNGFSTDKDVANIAARDKDATDSGDSSLFVYNECNRE